MFDAFSLIGYSESEAREILAQNGEQNIDVIVSSEPKERYNERLVCAVKINGERITLICGEFCLEREDV